jgi:hypothetical protein
VTGRDDITALTLPRHAFVVRISVPSSSGDMVMVFCGFCGLVDSNDNRRYACEPMSPDEVAATIKRKTKLLQGITTGREPTNARTLSKRNEGGS